MQYSVLMSVYIKDNAEYLRLAIESMLNQTVKPEQYVIVEDGPVTDEVRAVLDEYSAKEPELFTRVRLEKNGGLANALNEGLKHCRNELVARMDADDISLPTRCEAELKMFSENKELVICGCSIIEFSGDSDNVKTARVVPTEYADIMRFLRRRTPFNHPTVMYKKSCVLENGGYSSEIKRKQDYDLFSRMLVNGAYALNVPDCLFLFRADANNYARRKSWSTLKNAFRVYWRHYKRGGCKFYDFIIMSGGEVLFFVLPINLMRILSDKLLRNKYVSEEV